MTLSFVLIAVLVMGILGLVLGLGLAVASKVFYVYVDPVIAAVEAALPGANCGGCGFAGCSANAIAIVEGKSTATSCVAGGEDVALAIAAALGVSMVAREPDFARPDCTYGMEEAETRFRYMGLTDCRAAAVLHGGAKVCRIGCLGLGTCIRACPFDALSMGPDGIPVVDEAKCTGCGTCERICPKHIIRLSSLTRRILAELTEDQCVTPCQAACPAGLSISGYVGLAAEGKFDEALRVVKERMPFPGIIGRICPRPCETACRRSLADEAVSINCVKRFLADRQYAVTERVLPRKAPETGKKFAVAGGGIEGLSTGYFLARLGHSPTVFEATEMPGGLLRMAIAPDRLPREVLDHEIEDVTAMGVTVRTETVLGLDVTVAQLLADGYESVFTALGGWDARLALLGGERPGPAVPGVFLLVDVMRHGPEGLGERPVFVGGSKAALAAAPEGSVAVLRNEPDEKPGEGVRIVTGAVTALLGEGDALAAVRVEGLEGTVEIPATSVVFASGRVPELVIRRKPVDEAVEKAASEEAAPDASAASPVVWEALASYKNPATATGLGFCAPSDAGTDYFAAVAAVGAGRRAAAAMHVLSEGGDLKRVENFRTPASFVQKVFEVSGVRPAPRNPTPAGAPGSGEREAAYNAETVLAEASRCLQCGLVCYKKTAKAGEAA